MNKITMQLDMIRNYYGSTAPIVSKNINDYLIYGNLFDDSEKEWKGETIKLPKDIDRSGKIKISFLGSGHENESGNVKLKLQYKFIDKLEIIDNFEYINWTDNFTDLKPEITTIEEYKNSLSIFEISLSESTDILVFKLNRIPMKLCKKALKGDYFLSNIRLEIDRI